VKCTENAEIAWTVGTIQMPIIIIIITTQMFYSFSNNCFSISFFVSTAAVSLFRASSVRFWLSTSNT